MLNYDLTDDQADGDLPSFHYVNASNNRIRLVGTGSLNKPGLMLQRTSRQESDDANDKENGPASKDIADTHRRDSLTDETGGFETLHGAPRYDKAGNTRSRQRARKLQLGDIDWYGSQSTSAPQLPPQRLEGEQSLDHFIVEKKSARGRGSGSRRQRTRNTKG